MTTRRNFLASTTGALAGAALARAMRFYPIILQSIIVKGECTWHTT